MKKVSKFKKGAASFYIVAISTLILVIIAASFAAVIISEITRTSNDDLAQSAYDSALAGVEDAKLAYYNYQSCLEGNKSGEGCNEIIQAINNANNGNANCGMVANILGRTFEENKGVLVQESASGNNNMQQYYTCATIKTNLGDYLTTLNSSNTTKVVKAKFSNDVSAKNIKSIRVSWRQADSSDSNTNYSVLSGNGIFGNINPVPAVLSVGLVQTATTFKLSDFDVTQGDQTNRGTVYLVPTDDIKKAAEIQVNNDGKYNIAWNGNKNIVTSTGFLKSNDKTAKNLPYVVNCDDDNEFACSATIELPNPVGGDRSDETFMIVLSMPYAGPSTDVKLEFCKDENGCEVTQTEVGEGKTAESNNAYLDNVQISIDSTGRANDLYRRVETRLEPAGASSAYPLYAIQVLGSGGNSLIDKNLSPTCEWNFDGATGPQGLCNNT